MVSEEYVSILNWLEIFSISVAGEKELLFSYHCLALDSRQIGWINTDLYWLFKASTKQCMYANELELGNKSLKFNFLRRPFCEISNVALTVTT